MLTLGLLAATLAWTVSVPSTARAEIPEGVTWAVTMAGRPLDEVTPSSPLLLDGSENTRVQLLVDNKSATDFQLRSLRFEGRVLGMTFFSYAVRLDAVVPAGTSTVRDFDLDLSDLSVQSVGLTLAEVSLVAPDRSVIASRPVAVKVAGTPFSAYGIFGLAVALVTIGVLVTLLLAISRRRLPENRWQRGLYFLPLGVGLGLVITVTLSASSLLLPSATRWVSLVVVFGLAAFAVGYLLPIGHRPTTGTPAPTRAESDPTVAAAGRST